MSALNREIGKDATADIKASEGRRGWSGSRQRRQATPNLVTD